MWKPGKGHWSALFYIFPGNSRDGTNSPGEIDPLPERATIKLINGTDFKCMCWANKKETCYIPTGINESSGLAPVSMSEVPHAGSIP
jgi:hypothetical protein